MICNIATQYGNNTKKYKFKLINGFKDNEKHKKEQKRELKRYKLLILEKYIPGREVQVAVMGSKALGAIEIVPTRSFYDYEAKYSAKANTKHIIPVKINETDYKKILDMALQAHNILGCRGITRSDFRYNETEKINKIYILEVNTQPGMTSLSLVPEIANYYGISFNELVKWIINDASINR